MTMQPTFNNSHFSGRLHQRCDVPACLCPKGREHHMAGTDYEIVRCSFCGSQGTHIRSVIQMLEIVVRILPSVTLGVEG